jgi:hypothetical protein
LLIVKQVSPEIVHGPLCQPLLRQSALTN